MDYVTVYESLERHACLEMRLVLEAAGIPAKLSSDSESWQLLVEQGQQDQALQEISAYQQENIDDAPTPAQQSQQQPVGYIEGIFGYAIVIILLASVSWYSSVGAYVEDVGHVHAGSVLAGQWWRTFTALTLHADLLHLFSNLAFGAIFGILAGQMLGGGVAWLLILLGGAGGNYVNSLIRDSSHLSLGASTAVFSALGIAVAYALRPSLRDRRRAMQRWSPLIAGVMLFAFLGTGGERTDVDVSAHVTGFLSGLVGGWAASHLPTQWLWSVRFQWAAGLIAISALTIAWTVGLLISLPR